MSTANAINGECPNCGEAGPLMDPDVDGQGQCVYCFADGVGHGRVYDTIEATLAAVLENVPNDCRGPEFKAKYRALIEAYGMPQGDELDTREPAPICPVCGACFNDESGPCCAA